MTYTIFAKDKGKLNMDHCRKADAAIKSGFLETGGETVDTHESTVCFHSLKWEDIKPATELLESFGFEMMPEIYEEHYDGCFCDLVEVTKEIENGTLERVADDVWIKKLQRDVARDIACEEMPYGKCLEVLQKYNWFGTWTAWEINHRPVDIDEVREMVEQELGLW